MARTIIIDGAEEVACPKCSHPFPLTEGISRQAIERYRVSWWYSIAPMNVACMQVEGIARFDLSSLRMNPVTSFGITFTEPLAQQWRGFANNCSTAAG